MDTCTYRFVLVPVNFRVLENLLVMSILQYIATRVRVYINLAYVVPVPCWCSLEELCHVHIIHNDATEVCYHYISSCSIDNFILQRGI